MSAAAPPTSSSEQPALQGPRWLRWVPTSELELYNSEAAILGPIRPLISQNSVAGLNTIMSVHPKVPAAELPVSGEEAEVPTPPSTPVDVVAAAGSSSSFVPPNIGQTEKLKPLDADNYTSLVFIHGYAGGVANFLPIWRTFATDYDCYAFDIPGFGRNPRDPNLNDLSKFPSAAWTIDWYVSQFEQWFNAMKIGLEGLVEGDTSDADGAAVVRPKGRKIVIVAHSFGGYLASHFIMRHSSFADHFIMLDAWGINRYAPRTPKEEEERKAKMSPLLLFLDQKLEGVYWGKILAFCGPAAPRLLPKARPEFSDSWGPFLEDPKHFYDYSYHCNVQRPFVGEIAFESVRVKEGITGTQIPLIDRTDMFPFAATHAHHNRGGSQDSSLASKQKIAEAHNVSLAEDEAHKTTREANDALLSQAKITRLFGEGCGSSIREGFKISMIYGSESWLRCPSLDAFVALLRERNGLDVSFVYVDKAGHMPLVDNAPVFCDEVRKRL